MEWHPYIPIGMESHSLPILKKYAKWTNKYHKVVNCKYCKSVNFLVFQALFSLYNNPNTLALSER